MYTRALQKKQPGSCNDFAATRKPRGVMRQQQFMIPRVLCTLVAAACCANFASAFRAAGRVGGSWRTRAVARAAVASSAGGTYTSAALSRIPRQQRQRRMSDNGVEQTRGWQRRRRQRWQQGPCRSDGRCRMSVEDGQEGGGSSRGDSNASVSGTLRTDVSVESSSTHETKASVDRGDDIDDDGWDAAPGRRARSRGSIRSDGKAGSREDSMALLVRDVRELVEELMEQVGSTDARALLDLRDIDQKSKSALKGDPAKMKELRRRVLDDLEDVQEEIAELLEVKELTEARARLEKATTESTELLLDSAATAIGKGLDIVVNEGRDVIREGEETETLQVSTYFFGEGNEFWDDMEANGVTPRRLFLYTTLGAGVALGGNLFGVTSGLLGSLAPEASRDARLDVLFPIRGFKRCYSSDDGYEFMYPKEWVGDTGLALRRQRDLENAVATPSAVERAQQRRALATSPDVAFGPQGGDGLENVSLVKSELMEGFSLEGTLGGPSEAAEKLLSTFIAPPDSGKQWELLEAVEDERAPGGIVYQFEYRVQGQKLRAPMHNIGVVAARGSTLFTVTVLAPEASWGAGRGDKFRQMAKSFRLTY